MNKKLTMGCRARIKRWITSVSVGALLVAGALPLLGFTWWGDEEKIREVLILGADLHLDRQGTYSNGCDGGYGPPAVYEIGHTWEWVVGNESTCWNVGGISATGLLAAFERTRNHDYLEGAIAQGDTLAEKYNIIVTDDPEGAEWEDRPFSQDIEFLVRLSFDSRDWSYARLARNWYKIVTDNKTAEETADRYIDLRSSLAGWDLASQIRAALAVGEWRYARRMAKRLLERRAEWEGIELGEWDYTMSSYASLLWAFDELRFGLRDVHAAKREFRDLVLEAQELDGSWEAGDYQTTAYAILGLDAFEVRRRGRKGEIPKALGMAFTFLRDTQTQEGGWSYPPEYGEVNSEVLMAVGGLRRWEMLLPPGDPAPGEPQKPAAEPIR
jgi:hypothetical protein